MATARAPMRVWLDLARAGNFPSVASNVLAALVLASGMSAWPPAALLAATILAGCLLYAGGATFNDVADATIDQRHRPERAIPRGLVTRRSAAVVAGLEMVLGAVVLIAVGAAAAWVIALVATILVYDWVHKRWAGSVLLMAGCRALLAIAIATLPAHAMRPAFGWWLGGLFFYIVVLSVIARWEYKAAAPGKLGRVVRQLLAFIPLVDALALLLVGAWTQAMACALAVPLGRYAQRLAASS